MEKLQAKDAPLNQWPVFKTKSAEEAEHLLQHIFGARKFEPAQHGLTVHAHHKALKGTSLSYCSYSDPVTIHFPEAPFYRKSFLIGGQGKFLASGLDIDLHAHASGIVPPNTRATANYGKDFEQLLLRVETTALHAKLTALLGTPPSRNIEFAEVDPNESGLAALRRLILFLAQEIDATEGTLPVEALAEIEDAVLLTFLTVHRNNFTDALNNDPLDIAPRQVKLAEDYIEANWNSAITVETLADVVGVSARSVFNSFRQARGYTPMQFAKSVRLRRAHLRLSNPTPDATVTGVALECGFHNMGHFADDFKSQFGELPSETLKRGRVASRR